MFPFPFEKGSIAGVDSSFCWDFSGLKASLVLINVGRHVRCIIYGDVSKRHKFRKLREWGPKKSSVVRQDIAQRSHRNAQAAMAAVSSGGLAERLLRAKKSPERMRNGAVV